MLKSTGRVIKNNSCTLTYFTCHFLYTKFSLLIIYTVCKIFYQNWYINFVCIIFISFVCPITKYMYRQVSNIRRTLVGNKIVDHSDVDGRVGVNSIISTPTPTPTPEVSTPTPIPTPANLQTINSNSNSGGFNSNSNSNSGKCPDYQLQLQLRRFQLQFQLQLRSFKSIPNSISNPILLLQLNYHYPITIWKIVCIKWRYAVDICHIA